MYQNGKPVAQNYAEAVHWYRKAADQGEVNAQYELGVMYHNGQGVTQDDTEAVTWYGKAAEQGHVSAQFYLGLSFRDGQGVPHDDVEAYAWFDLAASRPLGGGEMFTIGYPLTWADRTTYANARDALAKMMTTEQVAEAKRRVRWWLEGFERRNK